MPTASELLVAWEHAAGQPPMRRDLALLRLAGETAAATPGRRNAALLRARAGLFGPRLELLADCPACAETLEFSVSTEALQAVAEERAAGLLPALNSCQQPRKTGRMAALSPSPPSDGGEGRGEEARCRPRRPLSPGSAGEEGEARPETHGSTDRLTHLGLDGVEFTLRLPTLRELAELPTGLAPAAARRWLAERCLVSSSKSDLSDAAIDEISAALADADPGGVLEFALNCPACGHAWSAPLDAGAVLEADLTHWARATLAEVHTLAAAYGWTEAEVLALTPARRRVYLELLGAV